MKRYLVTYETEFRGVMYALTQEISAPTVAQARVAFQARSASDYSDSVKSVKEID